MYILCHCLASHWYLNNFKALYWLGRLELQQCMLCVQLQRKLDSIDVRNQLFSPIFMHSSKTNDVYSIF